MRNPKTISFNSLTSFNLKKSHGEADGGNKKKYWMTEKRNYGRRS